MFPDIEIIKRRGEINAWDDPNFLKAVEATGRKKLIISGILTDICVAFPTLSAIEAGYDVVAAIDGSGTLNQTVPGSSNFSYGSCWSPNNDMVSYNG